MQAGTVERDGEDSVGMAGQVARSARSVRRLALGAIPVVMLSQCAPQCTPAPPVSPTVTYTDVTVSVPNSGWVFDLSGSDGRYLSVGGIGNDVFLDLVSRTSLPLSANGLLTADGSRIVTAVDDDTLELRDLNAQLLSSVSLPAGWVIELLLATGQRRVGRRRRGDQRRAGRPSRLRRRLRDWSRDQARRAARTRRHRS